MVNQISEHNTRIHGSKKVLVLNSKPVCFTDSLLCVFLYIWSSISKALRYIPGSKEKQV